MDLRRSVSRERAAAGDVLEEAAHGAKDAAR